MATVSGDVVVWTGDARRPGRAARCGPSPRAALAWLLLPLLCGAGAAQATSVPGFPDPFAKAVARSQGVGDPELAVGAPNHEPARLAATAELVLDLGQSPLNRLADGPGDDLVVVERVPDTCADTSVGQYRVAVGNSPEGPFVELGAVSGSRRLGDAFDLGPAGVANARYVRISAGNAPVYIDGIVVVNMVREDRVRVEHHALLTDPNAEFTGIASTPAVGNLDGDLAPEILITTQTARNQCEAFAIDGLTKAQDLRITYPAGCSGAGSCFCGNSSAPAIGDLDADGAPEILLYDTSQSATGFKLAAYEADGTPIFRLTPPRNAHNLSPVLENLDADAQAEILWPGGFLSHDGSSALNIPSTLTGQPVAVDLDADGTAELVHEKIWGELEAVRRDGTPLWQARMGGVTTHVSRPAVADLDADGRPDLISHVAMDFGIGRALVAVKANGAILWRTDFPDSLGRCSLTKSQVCTSNGDCPSTERCTFTDVFAEPSRPAVADLDGDGGPEVAVFVRNLTLGRDYVLAFDSDGRELWRTDAGDSYGTPPAVSASDLNGDGAAEVLWNGLCAGFTLMAGADGSILYRDPRAASASGLDYPVAADIDNDGRIEAVTGGVTGLWIFGNDSAWGQGRKVWNHLDYRISNVGDDLAVRPSGEPSWASHNSYLSQTPGTTLRRPFADAGPDRQLTTGDSVLLDGSGSRDADDIDGGQTPDWTWDLDIFTDSSGDGTEDNDADATGVSLVHGYGEPGVYVVKLTYRDDDGETATDFAAVSVEGPAVAAAPTCRASSGKVSVRWATNPDALAYRVYRHRGDAAQRVAETTATGLVDSGLTDDQTYTYTVRSLLADGSETPDSEPCAATPVPLSRQRQPNQLPRFTSAPPPAALEAAPYAYDADALDPDNNNPLTFGLAAGPSTGGMDPVSGALSWTPGEADAGFRVMTLTATDRRLGRAAQTWLARVGSANRAPRIISQASPAATEDTGYRYRLEAVDPNPGDVLRFALVSGPAGVQVDPGTGLLTWTPTDADVGIRDITVEVTDDRGLGTTQSFQVAVQNQNEAPFITSYPSAYVNEGATYRYTPQARDPDPWDQLAWFLIDGPEGMSIDAASGELTWRPEDADVGPHEAQIQVVDALGLSGLQTWTLTVGAVAEAPVFTGVPVTVAGEGAPYAYIATAVDPDAGTVLTWSLVSPPGGMTIDPATGRIQWTPDGSQIGTHAVSVRVQDQTLRQATQGFEIRVFPSAELVSTPDTLGLDQAAAHTALLGAGLTLGEPVVQPDPAPEGTVLGQAPPTGSLVPPGQPVVLTLSQGPAPATVPELVGRPRADAEAAIVAAGLAVGAVTEQTNNVQPAGRVFGQSPAQGTLVPAGSPVALSVSTGLDTTPPTVALSAPAAGSVVSYLTDVRGSVAADGDLAFYRVEIARIDQVDQNALGAPDPDWVAIGGGSAETADALLATFDPTRLANDDYALRLYAEDQAGNFAYAARTLSVAGDAKLGRLRVHLTDLSLPLAGIPIRVDRIYDSLNAGDSGDLGYGWLLSVGDPDLRETVQVDPLEQSVGLYAAEPYRVGTRVYLNDPQTGERLGFTFSPVAVPTLLGNSFAPAFIADPGNFYTLAVDPITISQRPDGSFGLFLLGFNYNPREFRLVAKDGTLYHIDQFDGLTLIEDRQGSRLEIRPDGLFHGSGEHLAFVRDGAGRIGEIRAADGTRLAAYAYDGNGDLVGFTDAAGLTNAYSYYGSPAHYLHEITDPRGIVANAMTYDAAGRLASNANALGFAVEQEWDPAAFTGVIRDAEGNETHLLYDEQGNVLQRVDTEGGLTIFTYDADGNVLSERDPRGHTTTYTYDGLGNRLTVTNPLGQTQAYAYDAFGNPTSVTNARNQTAGSQYDDFGHLKRADLPDGSFMTLDYDGAGRPTRVVDFNGNETRLEYDTASAFASRVFFADGAQVRVAYDRFGMPVRIVDERGEEQLFQRDGSGRLLSWTDAAGSTFRRRYDGGLLVEEEDPLGGVQTYAYDAAGRLERITDKAGGETAFGYDGNGNRTSLTDPLGNVTRFEYDGLNRMVRRIDPSGKVTSMGYDGAGNLTSITDRLGRTRRFSYDAANRPTGETWHDAADALVRALSYEHDAAGNRTRASDGLTTIARTFDAMNRVQTETTSIAGGPSVTLSYSYDGMDGVTRIAEAGSPVAVASSYDGRNRLDIRSWEGLGPNISVVFDHDLRGGVTGIQRTVGGGLVAETTVGYDLRGFADTLAHVSGGGAALASHDYDYDALGRVVREANDGDTLVPSYDANGQLAGVDRSSFPDETYAFDANGNRAGAGFVTTAGNRTARTPVFDYVYDDEGNLVERTHRATGVVDRFGYDHRNRLIAVRSEDSGGSLIAEATYAYDPFNRRVLTSSGGASRISVPDRDDVWADLDGAGAVETRYLFAPGVDQILARDRAGDRAWYLTDRLGSVRGLVDDAGALLSRTDYDGFGNILAQTDPAAADRFAFTGRELDPQGGLYQVRARAYDALLGRFTSEDPIGFDGGDTNLYRYVRNDPLNLTDPTGTGPAAEYATLLCEIALPIHDQVESLGECLGKLYGGIAQAVATSSGNGHQLVRSFGSCVLSGAVSNALGAVPLVGTVYGYGKGLAGVLGGDPGDLGKQFGQDVFCTMAGN